MIPKQDEIDSEVNEIMEQGALYVLLKVIYLVLKFLFF